MSSCILFACTCLDTDRLFVINEFIDSFKQHFNDVDIYTGINYGSVPEVESILDESNLNIQYKRITDKNMYTASDAGAYQAAMKLLVDSNKEYDNYWFIHTKGAVHSHSDYLRSWYIEHLINRRSHVENFMSYGIGSYGMLATYSNPDITSNEDYSIEIPLVSNEITEIFTCSKMPYFYIHSLYVIGKGPMAVFLQNITDKFFESKLNMYFFEGAMPYIASRTGYFTYVDHMISAHTSADLSLVAHEWILQNKKEDLTKYLNLPYRTYQFDQLTPQQLHVNSNT